ncbi:MAG TPA: peptidoglycan-associated lipoprotein Pal [Arenimonas sp.]|nr:peptidoglycan-associated lipoprotein Pal [Arenimonas sp.]
MNATTRLMIAASVVVALGACAKKTKPVEEPAQTPPPAVAQPTDDGRYDPSDLDTDSCLRQRSVYFDFDMDLVKPEFQAIMACHAKYLRDRPEARITLEGNADERGSREYNMGLGERRGNAVNAALQSSAGQLTVVSYGEERPSCTESSEDCWQKNRRVDIVYTAK